MLAKFAIPVTLALLILAGLMRSKGADPAIAEGYHLNVIDRVERIPLDFNGWVGQDVPLPPAAINLLRPNAILAREYYNKEREISATLLVVQCKDEAVCVYSSDGRAYPYDYCVQLVCAPNGGDDSFNGDCPGHRVGLHASSFRRCTDPSRALGSRR